MSDNQQNNASNNNAGGEVGDDAVEKIQDTAIGINGSDEKGDTPPVQAAAGVVLNTPVQVKPNVVKAPLSAAKQAPLNQPEEMRGGVVVSTRGAPAAAYPPELLAAMEICKSQTQSALHQVIAYCVAMAPGKPQTDESIAANQRGLLSNIFTILSAEDRNFGIAYRALVAIVAEHKAGAFRVTSRNRGLNTMSLEVMDNKSMRFFTRIVDLLVVNAGIRDVSLVKNHINIARVIESVYNARIKQNLTAYYAM